MHTSNIEQLDRAELVELAKRQAERLAQYEGRKYLNEAQLAARLNVNPVTLWRWRQRDEAPPHYRAAREVRYPIDKLEKWMRERMRQGGEMPSKLRQILDETPVNDAA